MSNNLFTNIPAEVLSMQHLEIVDMSNREQGFEDIGREFSPYIIHTNKINYFQENKLFVDLLKLKSLKKVGICLERQQEKEKLKSIITDKELLHKIGW
mgnify:CR=1 FL=1